MVLGLFDSGLGGLTVLREIARRLPAQPVIYFADTARLPYGSRTPAEICRYVREILHWFEQQGVQRVLMACNTSSALALPVVASEYALKVGGLIAPAARAAARRGRRIGVIATAATVQSHAYTRAIQALTPRAQVWEVACPEFVPLVEGGRLLGEEVRSVARRYLAPLVEQRIDTLVYGCTHYPYLAPVIGDLLPASVRCVDPAVAAVAELAAALPPSRRLETRAACHFFVSGDPVRFAQAAYPWLDYYPQVQAVALPPLPAAQTN
ncbi:glutamate racemase [Gloeobacter violaceus]|uniref:Glutamate racemase n=1 Tax=Gloeobacter violaceus (strain ATCC 29082 / PCC 7421) TaxID=251221 RepID=MURI_GLOVI|nr:glutamate racemase [Gloeobacter violaceus]Q7NKI2.1 RecName: Full=Glutamate racemase [Gloeobacter violaceus PCC 7421]BAC89437.1 glutamate racemase [Gloeobacter violaceus PCC 7421]